MVKARFTLTCTQEWELNPANYPEGYTVQQMLDAEKEMVSADPCYLLEVGEPTITVEVIN